MKADKKLTLLFAEWYSVYGMYLNDKFLDEYNDKCLKEEMNKSLYTKDDFIAAIRTELKKYNKSLGVNGLTEKDYSYLGLAESSLNGLNHTN